MNARGDEETTAHEWHKSNARSEHPDLPTTIGKYKIKAVLGEGAFGIVYLGRHPKLHREVAIKVARTDRFQNESDLERFLDEARNVAKLRHDHIVTVYDVDHETDTPYIVQEYFDGGDLAARLRTNGFSLEEMATVIAEVASALAHAHRKGIYHRDLKPSNILLDRDGRPFVADFGMALLEEEKHHRKGERCGTPRYMSPEQVRGEANRVDGRTDVWALGVILYEMLVGDKPFRGDSQNRIYEEILDVEPRPPRQINSALPRELERICLKCLSKRMTDRYTNADDLAADIRSWLDEGSVWKTEQLSPIHSPTIVPKGLRSFDSRDADFYLSLLPGPRDRNGLPQTIRSWLSQIHDRDADRTFAVGLMYGPSGCGKSSLVKAGIIPRLSPDVVPVYVEASAEGTEQRLLKTLRKRFPALDDQLRLPESIASLRRGEGLPLGKKLFIVLDQFEQWLHANKSDSAGKLTASLRQCDGSHVQCLLLIRDDFWLAVSRFMLTLEVQLITGHNVQLVDLFDLAHAEKVLGSLGAAYDRLPASLSDLSNEERSFLKQAILAVAEDDKVNCARLTLFSEMMKSRPWTRASLKEIGGTKGLGVTFLEESFNRDSANPRHRALQEAARSVLRELLPEVGTQIRGRMRPCNELLAASGLADTEFDELVRILDHELRLVTPTDPAENESSDRADNLAPDRRYYYLAHDYLVPSLREWLTQKQRETRRGRAGLLLEERADLWNKRPETRLLPSLREFLTIHCLASRRQWTPLQARMMRAATRKHMVRGGTAILLVAILWFVGTFVTSMGRRNTVAQTRTAVDAMEGAAGSTVPNAIAKLDTLPKDYVLPELQSRFEDAGGAERRALAYAMAHYDDVRTDFLISMIEGAPPDEAANLVVALGRGGAQAIETLRHEANECGDDRLRTKARFAIAAMHLTEPSLAADMCSPRDDPIQRSIFVDQASQWHGDLAQLAEEYSTLSDPNLRSAIPLIVGSAITSYAPGNASAAWKPVMQDWMHKSDAGTFSATRWALRRWGINDLIPDSEQNHLPTGRKWYIGQTGVTMILVPRVPSALTAMDDAEDHAFWISDCEITVGQFQEYIDDQDYPATHKRQNWQADPKNSPTSKHPAQNLTWYDAVDFCNWLSNVEGLSACYTFSEGTWRQDRSANGYRLPTEAEWLYACRAGASTPHAIGSDTSMLRSYSVFLSDRAEPCGSRMPNRLGIFDMHGNISEWCDTTDGEPASPDNTEVVRVLRGGTFKDNRLGVGAGIAFPYRAHKLSFRGGFRVVRPAVN